MLTELDVDEYKEFLGFQKSKAKMTHASSSSAAAAPNDLPQEKEASYQPRETTAAMEKSLDYKQQQPDEHPQEREECNSGPLSEDIYSLLYTSNRCGVAFWFSLVVFAIQMTIILLILSDLLNVDDDTNPLGLPPGVNLEVTIAQAISMALAVATQTNLLTSISRLALGYNPKVALSINQEATFLKYILSVTLQLLAGLSMLMVSFVLNMQSDSVLGLMLNFAALSFINDIQNIAFWVAKEGYFFNALQKETDSVSEFRYPLQNVSKWCTYTKRVLFASFVAALLASYGVLVQQQRSGRFLCDKIFVQFGDAFRPDLPFFGGIYDQSTDLISGRAVYIDTKGTGARFAYCDEEQVWTFSAALDRNNLNVEHADEGETTSTGQNESPCNYWLKSQETASYDILETLSNPWMVIDHFTNQIVPVDLLTMFCNDCDGGGGVAQCGENGSCVDNECVCNDGFIGLSCQFPVPCPNLELDQRTRSFPYSDGGKFLPATSYEMLRFDSGNPVLVYNKPVYVGELPSSSSSSLNNALGVILFTGRRWVMALNVDFEDVDVQQRSKEGLAEYLPLDFHGWFSKYRVYFISDPMDIRTPSDFSSPVDLQWYKGRKWFSLGDDKDFFQVDHNQPTNSVLLCPACTNTLNDCLNSGTCITDDSAEELPGSCDCEYGFAGFLCERGLACFDTPCLNGGNCTDSGRCQCPDKFAGKLCQYNVAEQTINV